MTSSRRPRSMPQMSMWPAASARTSRASCAERCRICWRGESVSAVPASCVAAGDASLATVRMSGWRHLLPVVHPPQRTHPTGRMELIDAQLQQLNDRARQRAVSLAEAVRSSGNGDTSGMEQLQHQQDDQLEVSRRLQLCRPLLGALLVPPSCPSPPTHAAFPYLPPLLCCSKTRSLGRL